MPARQLCVSTARADSFAKRSHNPKKPKTAPM